jgi:hypothetical protein
MGALEAVNGLLLLGISTAFLVSVITGVWSLFRRMTHRPVMPGSGMER